MEEAEIRPKEGSSRNTPHGLLDLIVADVSDAGKLSYVSVHILNTKETVNVTNEVNIKVKKCGTKKFPIRKCSFHFLFVCLLVLLNFRKLTAGCLGNISIISHFGKKCCYYTTM